MKKTKIIAAIGGLGLAAISVFLISGDHVDSPSVAGTSSDIADVYAFEGDNPNNTVLIATLQGALNPGSSTQDAKFDKNVIIQFKIDNNSGTENDFVEDLVIQAVRRGDSMYFFGPTTPASTGTSGSIVTSANRTAVKISNTTDAPIITTGSNGMKVYAGPRRDMFFFDFNQFNKVKMGPNADGGAPKGFLQPLEADDFFDNLNVLAVVVEVPNSLLGTAVPHVGSLVGIDGLPAVYNVWATTNRKQ